MSNIYKKLILNIFIFISFLALPFSFVRAQQSSQRWVCLNAVHCWDQKPESEACIIKSGHIALLTARLDAKLLPNKETYINECLATATGQICTAGTTDLDMLIYGVDNTEVLNTSYDYQFEGLFAANGTTPISNPINSIGDGTIDPVYWQSYSSGNDRRFLALNYFEPISNQGTGEEKTQQIGTFSFENAVNQSDCVSIAWDPYGRVFDSKTLEPVNQATVILYKKEGLIFRPMTSSDVLGGNIINPQVTKEDGGFSFVVPNGIYKLAVSHNNYSFPEELNNLQANYSKIYSDIYPAQTGVDIVQQGGLQHRDIPLKQQSLGVDNAAKLMEFFYDLDKMKNIIIVKGKISHPFAEIKAYSLKDGVRYRLLTESPIRADKMGNFILKIDQSKFDPTETFGDITIKKTDLTLVNLVKRFIESFISKVNAQVFLATAVKFEPILNYVEGYAYDSTGKVLPNATVSVYLEFSKKPYYQTVTDDKGFYKISSEFLPSMPYHLSYTSTNGQIFPTTNSKFIVQNKTTITEANIKINQFKNNQGEIISPSSDKDFNNSVNNNQAGKANSVNNNQAGKANKDYSQMIIFGLIILFLIILVLSVLVYLRKKQIN